MPPYRGRSKRPCGLAATLRTASAWSEAGSRIVLQGFLSFPRFLDSYGFLSCPPDRTDSSAFRAGPPASWRCRRGVSRRTKRALSPPRCGAPTRIDVKNERRYRYDRLLDHPWTVRNRVYPLSVWASACWTCFKVTKLGWYLEMVCLGPWGHASVGCVPVL